MALAAASFALDEPEVATREKAIEQCVGAKKYTIKKTTDLQKEGLRLWKENGNREPYDLPLTFEYVIESERGKFRDTHTCKIQQQPSMKWKVIDRLLWDEP